MFVAVILLVVASLLLSYRIRRLEQKVEYLEQQEFDARVGKLFNFLTEGLDPEDDVD